MALTLSGIAVPGAWAAPACTVTVTQPPGQIVVDVDPFAASPAPGTIRFALRNEGPVSCSADLAIVDRDRRPRRSWPVADTGITLDFAPTAGGATALVVLGDGLWRAQVLPGTATSFSIDALPRFEALPPAGRVTVPLTLELREPDTGVPAATAMTFDVVVNSRPKAQMNVAGSTGTFGLPTITTLDLGDLAIGAHRQLFLQLRSNVSTGKLTIVSENRGRLVKRREESADSVDRAIDYRLSLGDVEVPMASEYQRTVQTPRSMAGLSLSMDFTVADATSVPAGTYSDLLTIVFSPL